MKNKRRNIVPNKCEIWFANLGQREHGEQGGVRPVMILQESKVCKTNDKVWVVPFTSRIKAMHLPVHVYIEKDEINKLKKDSILEFEQIVKIPKTRLLERTGGVIDRKHHEKIKKAINAQFDFT